MRRIPPSVLVREELEGLLKGGADEATNIDSALGTSSPGSCSRRCSKQSRQTSWGEGPLGAPRRGRGGLT